MKYEFSRKVELPATVMWQALNHMDEWLPSLNTITAIRALGKPNTPFVIQGRAYEVDTPEGVTMHAHITMVDAEQMQIKIAAKAGPLRSQLSCQVVTTGQHTCQVTRVQCYPGIIGRLFTLLKGAREQAETAAYLDAWINYARALTN